jgi:hypothetical protein
VEYRVTSSLLLVLSLERRPIQRRNTYIYLYAQSCSLALTSSWQTDLHDCMLRIAGQTKINEH